MKEADESRIQGLNIVGSSGYTMYWLMMVNHGLMMVNDDYIIWLVVTGTMEWIMTFHETVGDFRQSQLTNSIIVQDG